VKIRVLGSNPADVVNIFVHRISEWTKMSILEPFRYRNDSFQSNIFSSDIGITDVDVVCRISPTLRSMSMPTYAEAAEGFHVQNGPFSVQQKWVASHLL
jgi:hypothetical protein